MKNLILPCALSIAALGGCGKGTSQSANTASSVSGTLSIASFPAKPTGVDAIDEAGKTTHISIDDQGRFQVVLPKDHTYRFSVLLASGSEPVVFPRTSKRLDTTVRVSSGAALVALGAVRHYNAAPAGGFTMGASTGAAKVQNETADGDDGECVNGVVKGTGAACVDDDARAACEHGAKDDGAADGECENGKDAKTGLACTDAPDSPAKDAADSDADANKPMAVPEHNAPDDVGGCDEGGSDDELSDD